MYYYADGESHFQLKQYAEAIPFFEKALTVCYENEKGDIHYRLGMCHMFAEEWLAARDHYRQALDNYVALRNTPDMQARIYQTSHMMKGCEQHLKGAANNLPTATAEVSTSDSLMAEKISVRPDSFSHNVATTRLDSLSANMGTRPIFQRDTIRHEIPTTINIQDLFNRQVEIKE